MDIERTGEGQYRIQSGDHTLAIDHEKFEDLFYSADTNPTAYYRVLVDSVCRTAEERTAMTTMINTGDDMEATLKTLQEQVKAIGL
jgi:hypothetical protein